MYDGIEIDMISLGDADSILVTQWSSIGPQRILIDGGSGSDAEKVSEFLHGRGFTHLWAVVCSHLHTDHANGLIKLVQDPSISIATGWMHDIRNHLSADTLLLASRGNSPQAESVRQVTEATKELASAFLNRPTPISPREPFAGNSIAAIPDITVLGPSMTFYRRILPEFADLPRLKQSQSFWDAVAGHGYDEKPSKPEMPGLAAALAGFATTPPPFRFPDLATLVSPSRPTSITGFNPLGPVPGLLGGTLSNSSVKENPATQPFNNTSVILGINFKNQKLMLTGDAGSEALNCVPAEWTQLTWMQVPHHGSDGNLSQTNIERFCPAIAYISACGDSNHPSRAIVSGLIKAGAIVFSTHVSGNLRFSSGNVPPRQDYEPAVRLTGTGTPQPLVDLAGLLYAKNRLSGINE
jgi:beta-lactamase superfamily II metal-dependent hydrolase